MATPGTNITVFRPRIFVAPLESVLPAMNLALGAAWPAAWKLVPYTEEGAVITPSAPQDDITADEVGGTAFTVPGTGSEITIGWTTLTPDLDLFEWLASFKRATTAAVAETWDLTITSAADADGGQVRVTLPNLDGTTTETIVAGIAAGATADAVATAIRGAAFAGWTTGGTGTTVRFTANTTGHRSADATYNPDTAGATGTFANVAQGAAQFHRLSLNNEGRHFMVGIEGTMDDGGLTDFGGFVRAFGYKVIQTEEVEINMRKSGEESATRLGAAVRCLATEVTATQKSGTGIGNTDKRFDLFVVPDTA